MEPNNNPRPSPSIRLLHFSDVHITVERLGWRRADWFNKRLPGWFNLRWLGRGRRFCSAETALVALVEELHRHRPDHVIFSGDATALGFEEELARAGELLGVTGLDPLPGLAVPGNHDYYTRAVAASGLFERYFAPWQRGERVDGEVYPFAQRVGPLWLVAVNSCTGNRWMWDAAGSVGPAQLRRLAALLDRLAPGPRILVTHYPFCLADGEPERGYHCLRDLTDLVRVAEKGSICLWLHGHRHEAYHHCKSRFATFPVVCAGSATQYGQWSYGDYTIAGGHFRAIRRMFSLQQACFRDFEIFEFQLPGYVQA